MSQNQFLQKNKQLSLLDQLKHKPIIRKIGVRRYLVSCTCDTWHTHVQFLNDALYKFKSHIIKYDIKQARDGIYCREWNMYLTGAGLVLTNIHLPGECLHRNCTIHNPSDHHMRGWTTMWSKGNKQLMRLCDHAFSHPDPDRDTTQSVFHICDGCCDPVVVKNRW